MLQLALRFYYNGLVSTAKRIMYLNKDHLFFTRNIPVVTAMLIAFSADNSAGELENIEWEETEDGNWGEDVIDVGRNKH